MYCEHDGSEIREQKLKDFFENKVGKGQHTDGYSMEELSNQEITMDGTKKTISLWEIL